MEDSLPQPWLLLHDDGLVHTLGQNCLDGLTLTVIDNHQGQSGRPR